MGSSCCVKIFFSSSYHVLFFVFLFWRGKKMLKSEVFVEKRTLSSISQCLLHAGPIIFFLSLSLSPAVESSRMLQLQHRRRKWLYDQLNFSSRIVKDPRERERETGEKRGKKKKKEIPIYGCWEMKSFTIGAGEPPDSIKSVGLNQVPHLLCNETPSI